MEWEPLGTSPVFHVGARLGPSALWKERIDGFTWRSLSLCLNRLRRGREALREVPLTCCARLRVLP